MENTQETIQSSYVNYVLENGKPPVSVYAFAKQLGMSETDFYQHYNSFEALEQDIWLGLFEAAKRQTESQERYPQYSVREKLLAFYFTWIEELKRSRSFVGYSLRKHPTRRATNGSVELARFRRAFKEYVEELIREGRATEEIVNRPYLIDRYAGGFYTQALFVLNFWINDQSKGFEQTDVAIEKAVNTSFDFVGRTPLDSLVDFAKFVYQNRTNSIV